MSMQSEGKDAKGRNYDQTTKGGSSSAGSMGAGGTGDIASSAGRQDGQQSAGRTDDLLSGDSAGQEAEQGFGSGSGSGSAELRTGMEGIGNRSGTTGGNRQSGPPDTQDQQGAGKASGGPGQGTPGDKR